MPELDRAAEVDSLTRMVAGTIMTPNEARLKLGLDLSKAVTNY